jgi:hypothetical protein
VKDVGCRNKKEVEKEIDFGTQEENLIDFDAEPEHLVLAIEDDEPYLLPTTGQWITPITSKSAGSSHCDKTSDNRIIIGRLSLQAFAASIPNTPVDVEQIILDRRFSVAPSLGKIHNLMDGWEDCLAAQRLQAQYETRPSNKIIGIRMRRHLRDKFKMKK